MMLKSLRNFYRNQSVYIVGKGPSLAYLTEKYFDNMLCPIICLNDSITIIQDFHLPNPIYSLQKDGNNRDHTIRPNGEPVLILMDEEGFSRDCFQDYPKRLLITSQQFGYNYPQVMSVLLAIRLAKYMGCSSLTLLCFDSLLTNDFRTFDMRTRTSDITPSAKWYKASKSEILIEVKSMPYQIVLPTETK